MHAWTGKNNERAHLAIPGYRYRELLKPSDHFHPAQADGLYTHTPNAVLRQKVVVFDGKVRISPKDRNQGT